MKETLAKGEITLLGQTHDLISEKIPEQIEFEDSFYFPSETNAPVLWYSVAGTKAFVSVHIVEWMEEDDGFRFKATPTPVNNLGKDVAVSGRVTFG